MKQFTISAQEKNLRLDQYLTRLLPGAGKSFLYKMLRKKNIIRNGKKADGNERLQVGDEIKIFFSDETFERFHQKHGDLVQIDKNICTKKNVCIKKMQQSQIKILYEDTDILIADKPSGMLSQKSKSSDYSINDWFLDYCRDQKTDTKENSLLSYTPSIANRLDRNTSGMILCGKTLRGERYLSDILKNHSLMKYYLAVVDGKVTEKQEIEGYLIKNERTNKVTVSERESDEGSYIHTSYRPLSYIADQNLTLIEVQIKTGKTHQIRAHLNSVGHALIGDPKYGNPELNERYRKQFRLNRQLLHCYKLTFPYSEDNEMEVSGRTFYDKPPGDFINITGELYGNLEFPRS